MRAWSSKRRRIDCVALDRATLWTVDTPCRKRSRRCGLILAILTYRIDSRTMFRMEIVSGSDIYSSAEEYTMSWVDPDGRMDVGVGGACEPRGSRGRDERFG